LNLKNLLLVSEAIRASAVAREDSRGAHYRADFPEVRDLERSRYVCVGWREGRFDISTRAVDFTRVKPGETLLKEPAVA
jgi:fumarate reductase flavoprotein subunit